MSDCHYLNRFARCLRAVGAVRVASNEDPRLRMLHPVGFVVGIALTLIVPVVAMFETDTLPQVWRELRDVLCWW